MCCNLKNNGHLERCSNNRAGCCERRAPNARVLPDKPPPKDRSQQRRRSQQRDRSQSRSRGQSARQQEQKPCPTTSSREMQLLRAAEQKVANLQKQLKEARSKHPERDKSAEARQPEPPAEDGDGDADEAMECVEQGFPREIGALQAKVDAMDAVSEKVCESLGPSHKETAKSL